MEAKKDAPANEAPEDINCAMKVAKWQVKTRRTVTSIAWEMGMLVFVLLYFVVVFVTFGVDDQKIARLICGGWITQSCRGGTLDSLENVLNTVDFIFLTLFLLEITIKLFGLGMKYLRDWVNLADFLIIVVSMVMTILVLATDLLEGGSAAVSLLPLFKIVRLLRVVLVMTRLQRSRERYRRMKMVGLAAPVERVFEIIGELRKNTPHPEDDKALAWIMDLIAKEELYKVSFSDSKSSSGMHLTAEMTDWLRSNLQASLPGGLLTKPGNEGDKKGAGAASAKDRQSKGEQRQSVRAEIKKDAIIPAWIIKEIEKPTVASILAKLEQWDFDVFALQDATNGHPLVVGGMHLMQRMGVLDRIPIPKDTLAAYLNAIEQGYVPANPFHNAVHASDVMFTTHYFLQAPLLRDMTGEAPALLPPYPYPNCVVAPIPPSYFPVLFLSAPLCSPLPTPLLAALPTPISSFLPFPAPRFLCLHPEQLLPLPGAATPPPSARFVRPSLVSRTLLAFTILGAAPTPAASLVSPILFVTTAIPSLTPALPLAASTCQALWTNLQRCWRRLCMTTRTQA